MIIKHNPDLKFSITGIVLLSALAGFIIMSLAALILLYGSSTTAIITQKDALIYKVRIYAVFGDTVILSAKSEPSKDKAASFSLDPSPEFSFYSTSDIQQIEFLEQPVTVAEEPKKNESAKSYNVAGTYTVYVSGYKGTLVFAEKDGYLYGYIQFPQWAKGVREQLKKVHAGGSRISFTRSVENAGEQKRIGAPALFTQNFEGEIINGGKVLRGLYSNRGTKDVWEAQRR